MLTPLALSGCAGRLSALDPAGPVAERIATLWWTMLAGSTAILALVMLLLLIAFLRSPKSRQSEARQERFWIYGLGLAFPLVSLAALLIYGLVLGEALLPRHDGDVVTVRAQARQWSWSFSYADAAGLRTQGVLHIPAGRPVDVEITTLDVIHSFWAPRLAGKLDAIPGQANVLRIEASDPGEYHGVSAEFSGTGYSGDAFTVIAHDPTGWDAFLRRAPQ
ncbi:MAG: cytochrome c oxidase subunit II [Methylocystis sp.]|uniref:cytochrome c oxidase subunit II n=1 Tax=Methylocystis sp. TaxID=1911079 RepID=UPI003D0D40AC